MSSRRQKIRITLICEKQESGGLFQRRKRVKVKDFPVQGRYGQGVIAWKLADGQTLAGVVVDKLGGRQVDAG